MRFKRPITQIRIHQRNCGFFSDFLMMLSAVYYVRNEMFNDFHIDWRNTLYSSNNENIYDKYFYQHNNEESNYVGIVNNFTGYNNLFGNHPLHEDVSEIEIYRSLSYGNFLIYNYGMLEGEFFKDFNKNYFKGQKVLGVHRRGTDHGSHGALMSDVVYLNEINREFRTNSYDKIFLITDQLSSFEFFKKEFGDSLITTNSTMSDSSCGVHYRGDVNPEKIANDVLTDAYLLSLTDYKLITRSNVSTFSLLCNLQKDNFRLIDKHIFYR
jgi:hypothetical protein